MNYFVVGAIFKNEAHILSEWLEHYLYHGVEKFYLINDNSSDNFMEILQPYIDSDLVMLYNPQEPKYDGRQSVLYDRFFLPLLHNKQVQWLALIDLDEFLYCPAEIDIKKQLSKYEHVAQVSINWVNFGSNGHVKQPANVVKSFTKRMWLRDPQKGIKNIINSNFYTTMLGIHESHVYGPRANLSWGGNMEKPIFLINHYQIQSEEFWRNIKMTRGDADCHHSDTGRDMEMFKQLDLNECEDLTLLNQNANIIPYKLRSYSSGIIPYRLELPQNTFHSFCKNLPGGSKYGTDGILETLLKQVYDVRKIPKTFFQSSTDHIQVLPCIYSHFKGVIHEKFNLDISHHYSYFTKTNSKTDVLSCDFLEWNNYSVSTWHTQDPIIILVNLPSNNLNSFLMGVDSFLIKKYTPIAFCKNVLIGIDSECVMNLQFPKIIGYKNTDFLPLYTNVYLEGKEWYYDSNIENEMCERNFLMFGLGKEKTPELLEKHKKKNGCLLWKPLFKFDFLY